MKGYQFCLSLTFIWLSDMNWKVSLFFLIFSPNKEECLTSVQINVPIHRFLPISAWFVIMIIAYKSFSSGGSIASVKAHMYTQIHVYAANECKCVGI